MSPLSGRSLALVLVLAIPGCSAPSGYRNSYPGEPNDAGGGALEAYLCEKAL